MLTVPIAQIVTTGNISFPGNNANAGGGNPSDVGSGTFLGLIGSGVTNGPTGNGTYNVLGGNPGVDPPRLVAVVTTTASPRRRSSERPSRVRLCWPAWVPWV